MSTHPAPVIKKKGTGGRPTKADAESRNSRIIAVATELFLTKGYSDTSLENIAATAGVAKRTIYASYGDKAAIFAAIIRSDAARITPEVSPARDRAESATAALLQLARRMHEVLLDPLTSSILQLMAAESKKFPEIIATNSREGVHEMHSVVAAVLLDLRKSGQIDFDDASIHLLAERFFDLVVGISSLRRMMEEDFTGPSDDELAARVAMFLAYHGAAA